MQYGYDSEGNTKYVRPGEIVTDYVAVGGRTYMPGQSVQPFVPYSESSLSSGVSGSPGAWSSKADSASSLITTSYSNGSGGRNEREPKAPHLHNPALTAGPYSLHRKRAAARFTSRFIAAAILAFGLYGYATHPDKSVKWWIVRAMDQADTTIYRTANAIAGPDNSVSRFMDRVHRAAANTSVERNGSGNNQTPGSDLQKRVKRKDSARGVPQAR